MFTSVNTPSPLVDQVAEVAEPPILPIRLTTSFSHIVLFIPAFAVGGSGQLHWLTSTDNVLATAHSPRSGVKVKSHVPGPATKGSKLFAVTPVPDQVPLIPS